jgi:3-oxoacyl-(acyl-carrier-protein) synthase
VNESAAVITGVGLFSVAGAGTDEFCRAMAAGKSLAGPLTLFEGPAGYEYAAEAPEFDYAPYIFSTQPYMDRTTALACVAARLCLDSADVGLPLSEDEASPLGLTFGSAWGCMNSVERYVAPILAGKARTAQGLVFTHSFPNSPASLMAIEYGLRGYSTVWGGSRLAGAWALESACGALASGQAEWVLAGASEALAPAVFEHHANRGDYTAQAQSRPLAPKADGAIPGEGACFFLLETAPHADARGARPLGLLDEIQLAGPGGEVGREPAPPACYACAPGIPSVDAMTRDAAGRLGMEAPRCLSGLHGDALSVNALFSLAAALAEAEGGFAILDAADEGLALLRGATA